MPRRPRGTNDPVIQAKQQAAVQMFRDGYTYVEIADELGYASSSGAWQAVHAVLQRVEHSDVDGLRREQDVQLAEVQRRLYARYRLLDNLGLGEITRRDRDELLGIESDQEFDDEAHAAKVRRQRRASRETTIVLGFDANEQALKTAATFVRVSGRRARLNGLDAPARVEHKITDEFTQEIRRLAAELEINDPDADEQAPAEVDTEAAAAG